MQKWEYKSTRFVIKDFRDESNRNRELVVLGDEGWELVSAVIVRYRSNENSSIIIDYYEEVLFFKRPK